MTLQLRTSGIRLRINNKSYHGSKNDAMSDYKESEVILEENNETDDDNVIDKGDKQPFKLKVSKPKNKMPMKAEVHEHDKISDDSSPDTINSINLSFNNKPKTLSKLGTSFYIHSTENLVPNNEPMLNKQGNSFIAVQNLDNLDGNSQSSGTSPSKSGNYRILDNTRTSTRNLSKKPTKLAGLLLSSHNRDKRMDKIRMKYNSQTRKL